MTLSRTYEELGGIAVVLRVDGPNPYLAERRRVAAAVDALLRTTAPTWSVIPRPTGWFVCAPRSARDTLATASAVEAAIARFVPELEAALGPRNAVRWGLWGDRFVAPYDPATEIELTETAWARIFDLEPANRAIVSERMFELLRRWFEFGRMLVPRAERRADDGYVLLARKRPSALDHLSVAPASAYVGRRDDLAFLDRQWAQRGDARSARVAIVGPPGAGKTRLVAEWRRRRPEMRVLGATFSVFGADLASFAGQLVELADPDEDASRLSERIAERIAHDGVDVLVLDDLHWAGDQGPAFLVQLCARLAPRAVLVILCARPSGQAVVDRLAPDATLALPPLPPSDLARIGTHLGLGPETAERAAGWASGNPLFVEQFSAWFGETQPQPGAALPTTLRHAIAARLDHLRMTRLEALRDRTDADAPVLTRAAVERELNEIEAEVGRWLDRLESGDYADGPETYRYLMTLQAIDRTLFAVRALRAGGARPPSNRLEDALERILLGSPQQILDHLRAERPGTAMDDLDLFRCARYAGTVAYAGYAWAVARDFFELAAAVAPPEERPAIQAASERCRRRLDLRAATRYFDAENCDRILHDLSLNAATSAAQLPEVWLSLARRTGASLYYERAIAAADAVGDTTIAELARTWST